MTRNFILMLLCLLALATTIAPAHAATRARLDRNQVALGETVTLTIDTDQVGAVPNLSPLLADFELSGQSQNREVHMVNGEVTTRTTHVVTLSPRHDGLIGIPALQVGTQRTLPIALTVEGLPAPATARSNAMAFLETTVDDADPYVQQSVGVTVRLFYAVPLASGQLDLETPEGASMQRIGEDVQSSREVNGRRYNVVERRFLLVPERSGTLSIPGARFVGRGSGGWMDDFLGGNSREMRANGAPKTIRVRAQPSNAPQPWLPLRDLRLRYVAAPQSLRAGEAAELVVEVIAQGATQAQMPELATPSVSGAQVFAEPPQYNETFNGGSPQIKLTRRYSLVPNGAGKLRVPGLKMAWWDVRAGAAKTAALPDLNLTVARGSGGFSSTVLPDAAAPADAAGNLRVAADDGMRIPARVWVWLAVGFAGLWMLTLIWAVQHRRTPVTRKGFPLLIDGVATPLPTQTLADLRRALDTGALEEVGEVLRGMSAPPCADLDQLTVRLDSSVQRDAIEQLRRARWADGDGSAARAALREAFRNGPVWRVVEKPVKDALPPLYPER